MVETQTRRDAIPATDVVGRTIENRNLSKLDEAKKHVENIENERKNIPEYVGGERDAGKFKAA
jgi:hypothetical protein